MLNQHVTVDIQNQHVTVDIQKSGVSADYIGIGQVQYCASEKTTALHCKCTVSHTYPEAKTSTTAHHQTTVNLPTSHQVLIIL